jgi:hypothetical protein
VFGQTRHRTQAIAWILVEQGAITLRSDGVSSRPGSVIKSLRGGIRAPAG